jgi:pimeloyl-ACP methyl ester carboxylesterase
MRIRATVVLALASAAAGMRGGPADEVESGMARVAEPVIFFEAAGRGAPVVLIHGGQMDRRMWDPQFLPYAKAYRVVRYDVRGYGRSATATLPYSDVADLLALLDQLGIRRAHLVGLSLGGRIAIDFTLEHPDRVASLTAVAPGLRGFPSDDDERWIAQWRAAQEKGGEAAAELWLQDPFMVPAMEHADLAPRLRELALANARAWLANPLLEIRQDPPAARRLAEIRVPVLVVIGDRDVAHMQKVADKLTAEVAGSKKVVIRGAGHIANMEKPQEFDSAVLEFLKAQPAAR